MTQPPKRRLATAFALATLLLVACNGEDPAPATETPPASPTTAPATTTPNATATSEAPPAPPPLEANGMLLIDVGTGVAQTLYTGAAFAWTRGFEEDNSVWIAIASENRSLHFGPNGAPIEEVAGYYTGSEPRCTRIPGDEPRAEIDGQEYPVTCGVFSPDGLRMLYFVDVENPDWPEGEYAAWVLDLDIDRTVLLTDELRHCGGCDGRAGPAWSPNGWYVIFGETYSGEDTAVYLADVELGETTVLARGPQVNNIGVQPQWSPVEDALIAPAEDGFTHLMRAADGSTATIEVAWPAQFDTTGTFVYSSAVRNDPFTIGRETVIARVSDGVIVASWPGRPQWHLPSYRPAPLSVTSIDGAPAALLEGCNDVKDECDTAEPCINGTAIYHPDLDEPHCLAEMRGAEWSPDRTEVAAARGIDPGPNPQPPYFEAWEIVLYDLDSGSERILVSDVRPPGGDPPVLIWNGDGTRILVQWPRPSGL